MSFAYKLVLFDLDGTLIDSASDIAEALNRALRDWNLPPFPEAVIHGWIGEGARQLVTSALKAAGSTVTVDDFMPGYLVHYGDTLLLHARVYAGVPEALAQLHAQGVKLAVCTNKPHRFVAPVLEARGLLRYIDAWVGGDFLPERKPSAMPLLHLAAELGVAVSECLMVGDSATDARAAQAAGIDLVLVDYGYAHGADLHALGARAVVGDLRALATPATATPA